MKDLFLFESERGKYLSLLKSEKEHFQVFVDQSSQGLGHMFAGFASNLMDLLGFLLILSRMHLIIDLDR